MLIYICSKHVGVGIKRTIGNCTSFQKRGDAIVDHLLFLNSILKLDNILLFGKGLDVDILAGIADSAQHYIIIRLKSKFCPISIVLGFSQGLIH